MRFFNRIKTKINKGFLLILTEINILLNLIGVFMQAILIGRIFMCIWIGKIKNIKL